ncbi:sensor histidine kinase [Qipengyuania atrilutea]|uniref:histidine kinase n=1 Tax=Qipengyuania atrilutea TaxID=2744473 RepID=A0A850H2B7_9SPHN|nr:HAMP domain-containing histidine kinase [Actirhodobacter atriluteus]NVD44352.1 HAMP domain-containing histidine kinase [Actirhodobacter atriluteus]
MRHDDRLATVLRQRAATERAVRTQFRQLLDLLGDRSLSVEPQLLEAAWVRMGAIAEILPQSERAAILREAGWRFRSPALAAYLAEDGPDVAAAALSRAELSGEEWQQLIPQLPIRARGFLRLRRGLPAEALEVLDRLGIYDRGLPLPLAVTETQPGGGGETGRGEAAIFVNGEPVDTLDLDAEAVLDAEGQTDVTSNDAEEGSSDVEAEVAVAEQVQNPAPADAPIAALVKRIETFQRNRTARAAAEGPDSVDGGSAAFSPQRPVAAFAFATDIRGKIDWADREVAPMIVGTDLASPLLGSANSDDDDHLARAFVLRLPVRGAAIRLRGAIAIAGDWVIDAAPSFSEIGGRFEGFVGKFRRALPAVDPQAKERRRRAELMRELLHELRTPVGAIQGFAEIIQQQMYGPTPHEYRAMAAAIAGDSALMLAGFEDLERLATLESDARHLEEGSSDLTDVTRKLIAQVQPVLSARGASLAIDGGTDPYLVVVTRKEAEVMLWRILGTLASAARQDETLSLELGNDDDGNAVLLSGALPKALGEADNIFAASTRIAGSNISSGIFGAGFALRLARAEARAAGGDLIREGNRITLALPLAQDKGAADNDADEDHRREAG